MKSILEICQECADLLAVQRPNDLFDENSQHERIFLSVAKTALDKLMRFGDWQELTKEGCLRTIEGKSSYMISNYAPDFYCLLNNTVYVKDQNEQAIGAITPEQWMRERYFGIPGTDIKFIIQNGMMRFLTQPAGNLKIIFQYRSNSVVMDGKSFEPKSQLTANSDIPIFDEYLVRLGIQWLWQYRNGMDYAESFNEYEREVKKRFGGGLAIKDINLAGAYFPPVDMGVCVNAATPAKQS
ncbi:MAG: hypothetical protein IJ479_02430 [Alphaproteobacteria bacterium]|nr:hypothetical protein [Alphaproteobacteria bacterium]